MPYRIKAKNAKGNSVTMIDMRNPAHITDKQQAELIAEEFANRQKHQGPWKGYVEFYEAKDSIAAETQQTRQEQLLTKMTAKRRGVDA
jgi:membrane-anchored protein YejM (alkaline phosphatase superfamily)